ncbi:hypothetical protein H5P28_03250 [Ruficoccus amylovorans]|uniref:Lipoprotein n=1 Tax=Ruficoccus amylovorans TaxID=1804625 RepID=A0A842HAF7_9BACT|nr:hypothetical protein [Ruficoccus amylovorans]MBC2593270.1 hypothetical protein [Ruficoccus amylovorans]
MFNKMVLALFPVCLLAGCAQFEKNVEADENAPKVQTLDANQSQQVEDWAGNGQINAYEAEQMQESINGGQ